MANSAIPLLQKHLQFIVDRYEKYHGEDKEMKPVDLGDLFSEEWTREAMGRVVEKGQNHLTQVSVSSTIICFFSGTNDAELLIMGHPT